jgi:hypothetical protein
MITFDSTKTALHELLGDIVKGKIQLPDFQRGWVWSDGHIRSLLNSIARFFPIGTVMLLETGGHTRFHVRPVEGTTPPPDTSADKLILDGQQRLTSLTQVLMSKEPVRTQDEKKKDILRHYYINIEKALSSSQMPEDAVVAVDDRKLVRSNFGRTIDLDLSSREKEFQAMHFPCSHILNSDDWESDLASYDHERLQRYMKFRKQVISAFRTYLMPVIELKKETTKEAVCLVFEKVNTGGVPLTVFELVTASYSAEGFNLREDWFGTPGRNGDIGRKRRLSAHQLLKNIEATEFLQGVTLLHSYERRQADLASGKTIKEATAVSAKREHVLELPKDAYVRLADDMTRGFHAADRFLRMQGFHHIRFLPYTSQLIPLAATMVHLGDRWLEPVIQTKIARWYWSGVLGEVYGSTIETQIANDLQELLDWVNNPDASEPRVVQESGFNASRLDTLKSRGSAAYRGLYVLLQRNGAVDFFWKAKIVELDRDETKLDIHHIFPRKWCLTQGIPPRRFNAIVNKTPISFKANRMIGGAAPSSYLDKLRSHAQVDVTQQEQDGILESHLISSDLLRSDDFEQFYQDRKKRLLDLIADAMGRPVDVGTVDADARYADDDDDDEDDSDENEA